MNADRQYITDYCKSLSEHAEYVTYTPTFHKDGRVTITATSDEGTIITECYNCCEASDFLYDELLTF